MKLPKKLKIKASYPALDGKEELRFELFDWLKEKNLTAQQAINLLDMTKGEIVEARRVEIDKLML